jgi:hypothetical protein
MYKKNSPLKTIIIILILISTTCIQANLLLKTYGVPQNDNEKKNLEAKTIDAYNLKKVGQYKLGEEVVAVTRKNNLLFLADQKKGLEVINITNKEQPTFVSKYQINDGSVYDIIITNDIAFLAHGTEGVRILNISNPVAISEIGSFNNGGTAWKLLLHNTLLFVADRTQGVEILNISKMTTPKEIGLYPGNPLGVAIQNNYLYVAAGLSKGFEIVNINDLHNPEKISEITVRFEDTVSVSVLGRYAFTSHRKNGVKIIDITNPYRPIVIHQYTEKIKKVWNALPIDHLLYLADEIGGIKVLDISTPRNPIEVAYYIDGRTKTFDLAVSDNLIIAADFTDGLKILAWKVAKPVPIPMPYKTLDSGMIGFNHTAGPLVANQLFGNETIGINLSLVVDVGLYSPVQINIEGPQRVNSGDTINLGIAITGENSNFWSYFSGSASIITPFSPQGNEIDISQYIEIAAFQTFIGENISSNPIIESTILWEQSFGNTSFAFTMTPLFNVTGTATITAKINGTIQYYNLHWVTDGEKILIPIKIPEKITKNYLLPLEEITFQIEELMIALHSLRFDLLSFGFLPIETWYLNISDFSNIFTAINNEHSVFSAKNNLLTKEQNSLTLFLLNGSYLLGEYSINLIFTELETAFFSPWLLLTIFSGMTTILVIPWLLIYLSRTIRKQNIAPKDEKRNN